MSTNSPPIIHQLVMCANLFVQKDGRWLMLKRSPKKTFAPNWMAPVGGKLEQNEDPLSGAKRELFEEAGIVATNIRLGAVILEIVPHKELPVNWLIFHFVGDYESGELCATEEGELIWIKPEEIDPAKLYPSVKETIKMILDPKHGTVFAKFEYDDGGRIIQKTKYVGGCGR